MKRDDVRRWVDRYELAWRTTGTEMLGDLFTEDAVYLPSPWAEPVAGLPAIAAFWAAERAGPDEAFTMTSDVVAVDGDDAVVRVEVDYELAGSGRWRDLWVLRFDGQVSSTGSGGPRCRVFEEWPFAPEQSDGH